MHLIFLGTQILPTNSRSWMQHSSTATYASATMYILPMAYGGDIVLRVNVVLSGKIQKAEIIHNTLMFTMQKVVWV